MNNASDSFNASIYNSMNLKTTEELRRIWQKQDADEWSPTALEAVRRILIERSGSLPEIVAEAIGDGDEEDVDLYHDPDRALKTAGWANSLSWAVLSVYSLFALGFFFYVLSVSRGYSFIVALISAGFIVLFGGVLFAVLQGLGEIILLLMDIEDNTRHK